MAEAIIKSRVIGVDVSFETTTIAIVDIRGSVIAKTDFPTVDYPNINSFVNKLCDTIVNLSDANGGYHTIRGISVPSGNYRTGCIENSPNMPWKGVIPLAAMLRDRLGLAVALANDSHAVALGEHSYGSARGMRNFCVVAIGHGLGNSICSNKEFVLGAHGFAGELGHTCAVENGRQCECGLRGCLETYVAEKGIVRTAREMMEASDRPTLMRDCTHLTPLVIKEFCDRGDAMSIEVYRYTGQILGKALASYAAVIDPEAIIIAGGISKAGHWLFDPIEETYNQNVFHNIKGKVKLLLSSLETRERDALGASALAWEVEEYSLFK